MHAQPLPPSGPANIVGDEIRNTEPATGRLLPPLRITPPDEVRATVERARAAQPRWAALDWSERRRILLRFRDILMDRAEELFAVLAQESGKPRFEALSHEVFPVAHYANFFGRRARRMLADERIAMQLIGPVKRSYLRHDPRGVIGVLPPWNYPMSIGMMDVIMSLAARNAVVVKPSEWTPRVMLKCREILVDAGLDPDLFGVVIGGPATGAALIDSGVDMVIFTGSTPSGRRVAAACGERLIPCTVELGGKDPALVLPDADLDAAARLVTWGGFANSGQVCASVERVLVHESVHDRFVEKLLQQTRALRQGDPSAQTEVDLGPMVVPAQQELVRRHVEEAVQKGARVLHGGRAHGEHGARFFEPTVLVDVTPDMAIWRDETFGPCLPVRKFRDVDQAVAEANDSPYGLSAYVFTRDLGLAERVANRLHAGTVMVNDVLYTHAIPETPWGGVKSSGLGRVHGLQGLKDLCEPRHVNLPRRITVMPLWLFPYREKRFRQFFAAARRILRGIGG